MFTNTVLIMVIEWWHYENDILRKTKLESLMKIIEIIKHYIRPYRNSHNCMLRVHGGGSLISFPSLHLTRYPLIIGGLALNVTMTMH